MTASIHGFKWDRAGYAEVMNSPGVQALVEEKAQKVAASCNASYEPDSREEQPGYVMGEFQGTLAKGRYVRTTTIHAYNSELKHNRLLDALG